MIHVGDDFGDLYADIHIPSNSAINHLISDDDSSYDQNLGGNDESRECDSGTGNVGDIAVQNGNDSKSESESESEDDDFVVVVNNDDFDAKSGDEELELGVTEGNLPGNGIDHSGTVSRGELTGNVGKLSGGNSHYNKHARRYGSTLMDAQRDSSLRTVDMEGIECFQLRISSCGQLDPTYAGSAVVGSGDQGNGFWLPRHRTILDVDIDSLEQKRWTHSGVDMTDYFNFGFDEDSWRSYCQSLDQLRHPSFTQMRNEGYGNWRSNLAEGSKEPNHEEFGECKSAASGQKTTSFQDLYLSTRQSNWRIGQAIHVKDSNIERQPSMDLKPPRICDPDVVIEIALREPDEPSDLVNEHDDILEAKSEMSEKRCGQEKLVRESQVSKDPKACEPRKFFTEEEIGCSSTPSTDVKRSHEPATAFSGILEKPCTHIEGPNSALDTQNSGKVDPSSGGNKKAPNVPKDVANSDRDSTDTNPCVAGIDLLSDDHMESNTLSSYSLSEDEEDDDLRDLRKKRNSRRSSPDSVMDRNQMAKVDRHCSGSSKRDDARSNRSCGKYPSRVKSPIQACKKPIQRHLSRHSEMKSFHHNDNDYRIDMPKHVNTCGRSRRHHDDEHWRQASQFIGEEWSSYKEKDYSLRCYNRSPSESRFHSEDDRDFNVQRVWDEDQLYPKRTWRTRGDVGRRECYLEDREYTYRKGKHLCKNPPNPMLEYSSSAYMDRQIKYRDYHDDYLNNRSKDVSPVEYNYSYDFSMTDRGAHSPFNGWEEDYLDSEIEYQKHLRYFKSEAGASGRGDDFFEHPSLHISSPRFTREDHEYQIGQLFPSIHDYHDEQPDYAERRRYSSLSKDDADDNQICHSYDRNRRYISANESRDVRKPYNNMDAYDRDNSMAYLDQDDYFGNRRHVYQYEGTDWQEDTLPKRNFDDVFYIDMLGPVKGIPINDCHGAKHGFVFDEIALHAQDMKDRHCVINVRDKLFDRGSVVLTRAKHERTKLWCENPLGSHNIREKKLSGKKAPKPGIASINDTRLHDGRFHKHLKEQQVLDSSLFETTKVNKALKLEEVHDTSPILTHCDLEEGQIPTEDLTKEFHSGGLTQKNSQKGQLTASCEHEESRILATMAKMEKRRERFKDPVFLKKDKDADSKPQVVKLVETTESTGQRPKRKRQWGGC